MQLSGRSWDLVVPAFFAIKSSQHQGSKVTATNLHGTWRTRKRMSSMFFFYASSTDGTANRHCTADAVSGSPLPNRFSSSLIRWSTKGIVRFLYSGLLSFQQGWLHGFAVPDRFLVFALWCPASRQFGLGWWDKLFPGCKVLPPKRVYDHCLLPVVGKQE